MQRVYQWLFVRTWVEQNRSQVRRVVVGVIGGRHDERNLRFACGRVQVLQRDLKQQRNTWSDAIVCIAPCARVIRTVNFEH